MAKKFTLIELLVVTTIISILVSILLPILKNARGAAQQIKCINNIKQIYLGINSYASDNNRYGPAGVSTTNYLFNQTTDGAIGAYLGVPSKYDRGKVCANATPPIARCPEGGRYGDSAWDATTHSNPNVSYSINHWLCYNYAGNFRTVHNSSKRLLCGDAGIDNWMNLTDSCGCRSLWARYKAAFRHTSWHRCNISFFDGHQKCLEYNEMPETYNAISDPTEFWKNY